MQIGNVKHSEHLLNWLIKHRSQLSLDYPVPNLRVLLNLDADIFLVSKNVETISEPRCDPALKNLDVHVLSALQQVCLDKNQPEWLSLWVNKLLRVCEIRRFELQRRMRKNVKSDQAARIVTLRLCLLFLNCFYLYNDARYVNIVLKIIDLKWVEFGDMHDSAPHQCSEEMFLKVLVALLVRNDVAVLRNAEWRPQITPPLEERLIDKIDLPMHRICDVDDGVVIFSPNPMGVATLCVAELLKVHGINVKAIVVRRLLNFKRLYEEIKRDGLQWVYRKITHKLLFRKACYRGCNFETIADFAGKIGITQSNVHAWCQHNNVDVVVCDTLNDQVVHDYLRKTKPKLVAFVGGGIISEKTLDISGDGVLNCHGGLLPWYRGLDIYEWPLLEKHPDVIGCTTHFMSKNVDEGDIFYLYRYDISGLDTFDALIKHGEVAPIKLLVLTIIKYLNHQVKPVHQNRKDGRQFFYMHPRLVEIAQHNLRVAE